MGFVLTALRGGAPVKHLRYIFGLPHPPTATPACGSPAYGFYIYIKAVGGGAYGGGPLVLYKPPYNLKANKI